MPRCREWQGSDTRSHELSGGAAHRADVGHPQYALEVADRLDRRGRLPPSRSAQRAPTRAGMHGRGGTEATITDANLILGRLEPTLGNKFH
jgi:hypothetical protein